VVAEAWDGKEALDLYRICRPDVVVMDVMMPGAGGIPATTLIREQDPHAHILPSTTLLDAQFGALVRAGGLDGQPLPSRLSTLALAILDAHGSTPKSLEPGSC
jgi:CheY-like chemotaxis protein